MDGKDTRERYAHVISDAALWLYRKYYRIRWDATFEPGPPTKPNPLSRWGVSDAGDIEAELWIYALRNDLFRKAEESPKPTEGYLRKAFHNCVRRAVSIGLARRDLLNVSSSQDAADKKVARFEERLSKLAAEDEDDQTGLLDDPISYAEEMDLEKMRYDTGTSISPTSNYWRGASREMNEDIKPKEIDERLLEWVNR